MGVAQFITLEGIEGVGKTTALESVEEYLLSKNVEVVRTREPGGTLLGEALREALLYSDSVVPQAELLMLFAARAQHLQEVILPALQKGVWVVCDRFTDASYAYQGGGRGLDNTFIAFLEKWVQHGIQPHFTFLLDAPVEIGLHRAKQRGATDRFESEKLVFFERVRDAYLDRARQFPERIAIVDATLPLAAVHTVLTRHLDILLLHSHQ